jgi:hypothetical protein
VNDQLVQTKYGVRWYDTERTVLLCEASPWWAWDDFFQAARQMHALSSTTPTPTQILIHWPMKNTMPPPEERAIPHFRQLISVGQQGSDLVVFVGVNALFRQLLKTIGQAYRLNNKLARYHFTDRVEEALDIIAQHKLQSAN